jgi:DNA-binding CsgD family transcriptional regulator
MAQGAMPPAKSLAMALVELRGMARSQRRHGRMPDPMPLLLRLLDGCRIARIEERASGIAYCLAGETEQHAPFSLTCILATPTHRRILTAAERAVADLICEGLTVARIAQRRGVTTNTVKSQVRQVFRKLNVDSRVALARWWWP